MLLWSGIPEQILSRDVSRDSHQRRLIGNYVHFHTDLYIFHTELYISSHLSWHINVHFTTSGFVYLVFHCVSYWILYWVSLSLCGGHQWAYILNIPHSAPVSMATGNKAGVPWWLRWLRYMVARADLGTSVKHAKYFSFSWPEGHSISTYLYVGRYIMYVHIYRYWYVHI